MNKEKLMIVIKIIDPIMNTITLITVIMIQIRVRLVRIWLHKQR